MRALSIAVVVASHFWVNGPVPGGFGVTVFFFISGFLITRLLLAEFNADGHISIGRFYVRRFLRLYPALFVLIVGLSALYFAMYGQVDFLEMIAALFYFMNYYVLVHPDVQMPIRMLWSLAIEEHYYFIFPLLFTLLAPRPWRFIGILAVVAVVVLAWRLVLVFLIGIDLNPVAAPGLPYTYIATDCRLDSILWGALLALLTQTEAGLRFVRSLINWPVFLIASAILLAAFLPRSLAFQETWRYSIQGVTLFPMVACCVHGGQFGILRRVLENGPMVWIGKISYSIYLWHFGIVRLVHWRFPELNLIEQVLIGLPVIFLASALSYYFVEQPVLALRRRWR
jgi:peptidoglycan/LPS O-acetylase OafA/YrhL